MKIAVIGIGAMGAFYAAKLSKKYDVIAYEHFDNKIEAVNKNGIDLIEDGITTNYKFKCFKDGEANSPVDLVLVCVKSTQTSQAIKSNIGLIDSSTIVVTMQNGLGNVRDISKFVDPSNIVVGSSEYVLENKDLNVIKVVGKGNTYFGSVTNDMKDVLTVKVIFNQAGFVADATKDIESLVWGKLLINSTINPLCALFKCKIKVLYENKNIWNIVTQLVDESVKVANSENLKVETKEVLEEIQRNIYALGSAYPSMYQDVKNSRITEIDRLNGQIVSVAYKNNVSVPYNEFILNSIKAIEKLY